MSEEYTTGPRTTTDSMSEGRMKKDVSGMKRKKRKVLMNILNKKY